MSRSASGLDGSWAPDVRERWWTEFAQPALTEDVLHRLAVQLRRGGASGLFVHLSLLLPGRLLVQWSLVSRCRDTNGAALVSGNRVDSVWPNHLRHNGCERTWRWLCEECNAIALTLSRPLMSNGFLNRVS
jgi:hypothetical protein